MSSIRSSGPFVVALVLAAGAFSACSSSSSKTGTGGATGSGGSGTGTGGSTTSTGGHTGTGGMTAGTGGATATDAGHDTTADVATDVPHDTATDTTAPDASPATITVTSSALTEGATFAATNTCAGVNTSPPLTWTAGPSGTMSYTVALTDLNNGAVHWILWDIPAGTTTLPPALPAGSPLTTPIMAMQLHRAAFFGAGTDYRGPCPNGNLHNYQFEVNAIGTTTLAGTAGMTTDQIQVLAKAASLGHGDLTGMSAAVMATADAGGQ
jgi:Raf kinase inhibitor-like YbhB/YbcL family protein